MEKNRSLLEIGFTTIVILNHFSEKLNNKILYKKKFALSCYLIWILFKSNYSNKKIISLPSETYFKSKNIDLILNWYYRSKK